MVTFVPLSFITSVILFRVTLHLACRPAVYSVLVTRLSRVALLVCPYPPLRSLNDLIPSLAPNKLILKHSAPIGYLLYLHHPI